jgi:hypothetical protein
MLAARVCCDWSKRDDGDVFGHRSFDVTTTKKETFKAAAAAQLKSGKQVGRNPYDNVIGPELVRLKFGPPTGSGRREGWAKHVTGVDLSGVRGAKAFKGDYLRKGEQLDMPYGSVVIVVAPEGSVRSAYETAAIYLTSTEGLERTSDWYNWRENFLSFRDLVNDELKKASKLFDYRKTERTRRDEAVKTPWAPKALKAPGKGSDDFFDTAKDDLDRSTVLGRFAKQAYHAAYLAGEGGKTFPDASIAVRRELGWERLPKGSSNVLKPAWTLGRKRYIEKFGAPKRGRKAKPKEERHEPSPTVEHAPLVSPTLSEQTVESKPRRKSAKEKVREIRQKRGQLMAKALAKRPRGGAILVRNAMREAWKKKGKRGR